MKKKKKSNPSKLSEGASEKQKSENPDKRHPNPGDPFEESGSPIKKMLTAGNPHQEEILN